MTVSLDHTIVDVTDPEETIRFYGEVLGFEYGGSTGYFEVIRINDDLSFDLVQDANPEPRHFAFVMDRPRFEWIFENLKAGGYTYGDGPSNMENMKGPGRSTGSHGRTYSVYFKDPSGHQLEIITYQD